MDKKCYDCIHRGEIPGSAHSRCRHPKASPQEGPFTEAMAIFASVGRVAPFVDVSAAKELGIIAHPTGIKRGWFNWPYNFDPVWLESCNGFEEKLHVVL
jgi:hypothetical protein